MHKAGSAFSKILEKSAKNGNSDRNNSKEHFTCIGKKNKWLNFAEGRSSDFGKKHFCQKSLFSKILMIKKSIDFSFERKFKSFCLKVQCHTPLVFFIQNI